MKRILERRTNLSDILSYLHYGKNSSKSKFFPKVSQQVISKGLVDLLERLTCSELNTDMCASESDSDMDESPTNIALLNEKLQEDIRQKLRNDKMENGNTNDGNRKKTLKREITIFDESGFKGPMLSRAYEYLLTIRPTSVESERAFSATTYFCSKLRTRLSDDTIDHLCFLRAHFQA